MAKLISADLTNNKLCILEYTTTDGQMLSLKEDKFDAKIVSHTYTDTGKVIFDKPITRIGECAFYLCKSLTSVTIPNSVTTIGEGAFSDCDSLKEFKGKFAADGGRCLIINGVLNAFALGCGVTQYAIPNSVTTIGEDAFSGCRSLTSVTIPDSVTTIGDGAFAGCKSLTSVTIGNGVTTIGESAFFGCTSLTSVTIPDSVTMIGEMAFFNCSGLTSVTIPNSVTTIGEDAFSGCRSLTSVTIPDSVTAIGGSAFSWCRSIKEFKGKFVSEDGRCLIVDGILKSFAPAGLTEYTIPNSVKEIGEEAFTCCKNLTSITIPNSVMTIGRGAFRFCESLKNVTIPDSVMTIGNYTFYKCKCLKNITIGKGASEIGKEAFKGCNIDTIVCCPEIPPKINDSFDKFENLIVPTGCEKAYANSDWGKYLE